MKKFLSCVLISAVKGWGACMHSGNPTDPNDWKCGNCNNGDHWNNGGLCTSWSTTKWSCTTCRLNKAPSWCGHPFSGTSSTGCTNTANVNCALASAWIINNIDQTQSPYIMNHDPVNLITHELDIIDSYGVIDTNKVFNLAHSECNALNWCQNGVNANIY